MTQKTYNFTVTEADIGVRLDKFLASEAKELSRARVQALIEQGNVTCGNKSINDSATKVKINQQYQIVVPEAEASHIVAQKMDLDIVFEDEHLLVINKRA